MKTFPQIQSQSKNARKIEVVAYDPRWPQLFKEEADRLQRVLGNHLKEIHHIGSTAIPDMSAKPVIDLLLECENLDEITDIDKKLQSAGYDPLRRSIVPHRIFFTSKYDDNENIGFHCHVQERGDPQVKRHVNFRDYLIHHPIEAKTYKALKIQLAEEFAHDRFQYVIGKNACVQAIDGKTKRWQGRRKDFLPQNTGIEAIRWSAEKLLQAKDANFNLFITHFAQYLKQVELMRVPGFTLVDSGLPDETFNAVLDADFTEENVEKMMTEIREHFANKHLPWVWWVSPSDKPPNLPARLQRRDINYNEIQKGTIIDLDALTVDIQSSELTVVRAMNKIHLQHFAFVLAKENSSYQTYFSWLAEVVTEDDPIEFYVAYVKGEPKACGVLVMYAQIAGLYWLSAQKNEHRTAIAQYLLQHAKALGYHIAVVHEKSEELLH